MQTVKHLVWALALTLCAAGQAQAQMPALDVAIGLDHVRFVAVGQEMRVEVFAPSGEMIFDSGTVTDQPVDWKMQNQTGEHVPDGVYLVIISLKMTSGEVRKRIEQIVVGGERAPANTAPSAPAAAITGTGTANRIAKFTGAATIGNSVIYESGGRIGIGITAPTSPLYVRGTSAVPSLTSLNTTSGAGVFGVSTSGYGLSGKSTSSDAVHAMTAGNSTVAAVHGIATSSDGNGVFGEANGGAAYGVWGRSTNGKGVRGESTNGEGVRGSSENGDGVYGTTSSSGDAGVHGYNHSGGNAVYGETDNSTSSAGVKGFSFYSGGNGVMGEANTGTNAFGVWGKSTSGYAGYFTGNVFITGSLSQSRGSFMIDHPLDPANKYLLHSFVESPDMMNIYNGNVTLDENGEAIVTMPRWFSALNKEFRYQLTAIGAPGPNLYIGEKMKGNQFKIAGGTAGMEVSWQVTGIRKDAYAEAHRIQVEEDKPEAERGFYLHPELFQKPEEKGIDWARKPEAIRLMKERDAQPYPQQPEDRR